MGFFGNIIDSVTGAVDWAVSQSSQITDVIDAIATVVVGSGATAAETVELPPDSLVALQVKYDQASAILKKKAEITTGSTALNVDYSIQVQGRDVCGLWSEPATLTASGLPSLSMYQDLSKFLKLSGAPVSYISADGTERDTATDIGTVLFANAPIPAASIAHSLAQGNDVDPVTVVDVTLGSAETCIIQAKHAYYDIPITRVGSNSAWHGAIQAQTTTTSSWRKAYAAKHAAGRILAQPNTTDTGGDVWVVTLNLGWTNSTYAHDIQPKFISTLQDKYSEYTIQLNEVQGASQVLKLQARLGVTPAVTRAIVTDAAQLAIGSDETKEGVPVSAPTILVRSAAIVRAGAN